MAMIEVRDVHKSFGEQVVLEGINISVEAGTMMAMVGNSGTGKSVLLKNIVGLMRPDRGHVLLDGHDIHHGSRRELAEVRDSIGMVFQGGALFDSMTVHGNLSFPLTEKTRWPKSRIDEQIALFLGKVGLTGAEAKYPSQLSGGMQKRVALARALLLSPKIIFFDEPTTGLDPYIANAILRLIYDLQRELGFTGVIVTHDFHKVFQIVSKVVMLHQGRVVADLAPDAFMNSADPLVSGFVREEVNGPLEGAKR